ncbi:TIGR00300 family protein [bacterium]|nr:TIGR00300 family protein [bacterium]
MASQLFSAELTAEGHLVDSGIMAAIMDCIIKNQGQYEISEFVMGRTNQDISRAKFKVFSPNPLDLEKICESLHTLGCQGVTEDDATLKTAEKDWVVPDDFYSTTNHQTEVKIGGKWIGVQNQRMDAVLVCRKENESWSAFCCKLRNVRANDLVVCGYKGIRIKPEFKERDREDFAFMDSEVSSERRVRVAVGKVARILLEKKRNGEKIGVTAGPVVIHTGGAEYLSKLIKERFIDFILAGNALAVHDIEQSLFHTSLGIDVDSGEPVEDGHRNHMRAINAIFRQGSIKNAVNAKILSQGIFYECVQNNVPFVLAGSIRDDGPLPEVITDMNQAQAAYFEKIQGCSMMLILSTMLHGIGVGNMLPGRVKTICVDINPAVVTKLADRGSHQTIGIVTDVGTFLSALYAELKHLTA